MSFDGWRQVVMKWWIPAECNFISFQLFVSAIMLYSEYKYTWISMMPQPYWKGKGFMYTLKARMSFVENERVAAVQKSIIIRCGQAGAQSGEANQEVIPLNTGHPVMQLERLLWLVVMD